jgi:enoyl-[acyl-carrier protein] reductase III
VLTICVTGGSSGIGRAIAERFAGPGVDVFITYSSRDDAAAEAAKAIAEKGARPHVIKADVGTLDGIDHIVSEISKHTDHLDQLVHAAAMAISGRLVDMPGPALNQAISANGASIAHLVREARPLLRRGSSVIFVTSAGSTRALKGYGALGAPKALAEHLTRYLAIELGADGIRVNCVSPGPLDTEARRRMFPETWEQRLRDQDAANPSGRGVRFDDVSGVVELMCRPEFAMVQGQVITIDGGLTL